MRATLLLFACAGCIEPSVLQCGDQICPSTTVCIDDAVCATPSRSRCAGTYTAIDARGGDVLATTTTTVERYHAGSWTTLPAPVLSVGR